MDWVWRPPSAIRSVAWPRVEAAPVVEANPELPLRSSPERIAFMPVDAGDQVRLVGSDLQVGFASGTRELYPDTITWQHAPAPAIVRIPTWSSARFLAIRAARPQDLGLEVAARAHDPLRAHRLDGAVYAWLTGDGPKPEAENAQDRRSLLALEGLHRLVGAALGKSARPSTDLELGTRLLHSLWLERILMDRPLPAPFFVLQPALVVGGQALEARAESGSEDPDWRALEATETLSVPTQHADVVSLWLRARALGQTRVQVWAGNRLVHDAILRIPGRSESASRWTPARVLRVVPFGHAEVRVRVIEGSVRARAEVRRAEHGLLEPSAGHRPTALAERPLAGAGPDWLRELSELRVEGGQEAWHRLERRLTIGMASEVDKARAPGTEAVGTEAWAVILYTILPALGQRASLGPWLARFWDATSYLPEANRTALRISLLERLQNTLPDPLGLEHRAAMFDRRGGSAKRSKDARLLDALMESVLGAPDGQRSNAMAHLEALAASHADDARLVELSRIAWSRAAPWTALEAPGAAERTILSRPFDANQPSGMCENQGPHGLRWWIVPSVPTDIDVQALGGTHTSLRLLPLDAESLVGAEVQIGDQTVRVQPVLGEASRVGVRPGVHRIQHRGGAKVIARIPRLGVSRCEDMLEMERWLSLAGELVFPIPGGPSATVASLIVDPKSIGPAGAVLEVSVGGESTVAWVRTPASGDVEVPVPAGATELRVRADRALLVRARVRMHPQAVRRLVPPPVPRFPPGGDHLAELARLTAALRESSNPVERDALRSQRAEALHSLGYPELAGVEWQRGQQPEAAGQRSVPGALFLPDQPQDVVPLGVAARAPLLPLSKPELVVRALADVRLGRTERALAALLEARAAEGNDLAALLTAQLAAEQGNASTASVILERLAHATASGALFEAAAQQYDVLAVQTQKLDYTRQAFLMAKLAARHGVGMNALLSRYQPAVEWNTPSLSTLGAFTVNVDTTGAREDELSIGSRVRRALTLAPAEARFIGTESVFNVRRWRGQALRVTSLCFNREGPLEGCRAELRLDGEPLDCPVEPATSTPTLDAHVAIPRACAVPLTDRARELTVRLPVGQRRMGWALLENVVVDADVTRHVPVLWQQNYASLETDAPIRLQLTGPSVLRVDARATGSHPGRLLLVDQLLEGRGAEPGPLEHGPRPELGFLPGGLAASASDPDRLVSAPQRLEYVLTSAGLHEIALIATAGTLLVRPEVAQIVLPPEPELELPAAPEPVVSTSDALSETWRLTAVETRAAPPPLSLSAELGLSDRDLAESDEDAGDRHAQPAVVARKALFDEQLWLEAAAFGRFRDGAPSLGVDLAAVASAEGRRPGAFVNARVVGQPELSALGASASVGVRHRIPVGERMNLLPEISATWRRTEPSVSAREDVDGDVYSGYAALRPLTYDIEAVLSHRPFTDLLSRPGIGMRLTQDLRGVDRVEARIDLDFLPGSGLAPWFNLGLIASHRPESPIREHPFTRWQIAPGATLWHWLGEGSRLRTDLNLSIFVDTPNPAGSQAGLFASLVFAYDFLLGGGLTDFRTTARPFRDRLQEGGPLASPGAPANDTYWVEAALP